MTVSAAGFGGTLKAIASKSCAHRLLICAALSDAPTVIECGEYSEDILATVRCLSALGADIQSIPEGFSVRPLRRGAVRQAVLDCGESGSTLRFLLPVAAALGVEAEFLLGGRLPERPLSPLYELLTENGVQLSEQGKPTLHLSGQLRGERFTISGGVSSQFISGLLFALPLLGGGSVVIEGRLESAGYVDLTRDALQAAGVQTRRDEQQIFASGSYHMPARCAVEGDWSNAAFWLCAGAIGPAPVTLTGLNPASSQGDRAIVALLRQFGAAVTQSGGSYTAAPAPLRAMEIDAAQIPDLVPILAAVAACADGCSRIYGAARLRIKESDRLRAVCQTLGALGADIAETPDGLLIRGGALHGGTVRSWGDHRIAMTAAVCSLRTGGAVTIADAQAVRKSYPGFFDDFVRLGGCVERT